MSTIVEVLEPTSECLGTAEIARALGTRADSLATELIDQIDRSDLRYQRLRRPERDAAILRILRRLESGNLDQAGEHRRSIWESGWGQNLAEFASANYRLEALVPRFIRPEPVLRIDGDFVRSERPDFELRFFDIVRRCIFLEFLADCSTVHEFGCGSGYNLVAFSEHRPQHHYHGLDWAQSAVDLVNLVGRTRALNLRGTRFDFFAPDDSVEIGRRDGVLTVCALEQVGARHEPFLQFLLHKRPAVCVHVEPLTDLYDPESLVDHLAIRFHAARGYLTGFLGRLRQLEADGRISIERVHRMRFGSLFHEGYSLVVWRPR